MLKAWLLGHDKTRQRNSFLWNSASGFLNALQSTFILFVLQRVANEAVSGEFSIAFATANLMLAIGKYGVRYFQSADIDRRYSYGAYFANRLLTSGLMVLVTVLFCTFSFGLGKYTLEKTLLCFFLCVQKTVDSLEDVIYGEYQRADCLDTAGRAFVLRLVTTTSAFLVGYILTKSLIIATVISLVVAALTLLIIAFTVRSSFAVLEIKGEFKAAADILLRCFPLFLSGFLSLFLVNAPKYAIDSTLTAEMQAVYSFISMPVFVVALLAECLFRPMVTTFSKDWLEGNYRAFVKRMLLVIGVIVILTIACVVGGVLVGLPILNLLFNYDLHPYWLPLGILLLGGGALALCSFLTMILTVIRRQRCIAFAYIIAAAISLPLSMLLVKSQGLFGAALAYFIIIGILCISIISFLVYYLLRKGEV